MRQTLIELEAIGAAPDSEFDITIEDTTLIVKPIQRSCLGRERVEASISPLRPRYAEMLYHLAH